MVDMFVLVGFTLLLGARVLSTKAPPPAPPSWPVAFSVKFQEEARNGTATTSRNDGAWYYDWSQISARFDHLNNQNNWICQGRGLNVTAPHGDCQVLFSQDADMFVIYPGEKKCCRACGPAEGCTVPVPNWLAESKFIGNETINGTGCMGWEKAGTHGQTTADRWYQTAKGKPCQYWESVTSDNVTYVHTLTFNQTTFHIGQPDASVFAVPDYCDRYSKCPNPWPH
ncbi:uncharacterized protein [Branchiostoma lanceolatum]|uniref:uncharacterized protein n=1 Tax=Branchiostoma lanceolatum TaxID=7740 RepID=UPI0034560152